MTFEQLTYVLAVAKYKNFTRAAEECYISQSSLSTHINNLETELGVRIFDRSTRPLSVTPSGNVILQFAQNTMEHSQMLQKELKKYSTSSSGTILLGILPGGMTMEFLASLKKYQTLHPDVHFDFHEDVCNALQGMVMNNELDFAMMTDFELPPGSKAYPYYSDQVVLVVSPAHPLAGQAFVTPEDLLQVRHITHKTSPLFAFFKNYMRQELNLKNVDDCLKTYYMHNTYYLTDLALANNGWGTMLITRRNAERYVWMGYRILELKPELIRNFYFVTSSYSDQLPIVQNFVKFICQEAMRWQEEGLEILPPEK